MVLAPKRFVGVVALLAALGCDRRETAPSPLGKPSGADVSLTGVSVSSFTVGAWYAEPKFHYVPRLAVTADATMGRVRITELSFVRPDDSRTPLRTIRYGTGWNVEPGGSLELLDSRSLSPFVEIASPSAISILTARVSYVDDTGRTGVAIGDAQVPVVNTEASSAVLAIQAFTVERSFADDVYVYLPKLTLEETGGVSDASIVKIQFQLMDAGPHGNVPPYREPMLVLKGQRLVLDDGYYGPWLEITNSSVNADRVSVVIDYTDASGRGGTASALADVVKASPPPRAR